VTIKFVLEILLNSSLTGSSGAPVKGGRCDCASQAIYLTLEIAADTSPSGETLVKLLPLVLAAVCAVVASVPTMAVANSTAATTSGSQSAERNLRVDVGLECLSEFDLPLDPEWTPLDPRLNSDELLLLMPADGVFRCVSGYGGGGQGR
jgi:hypothetical protein